MEHRVAAGRRVDLGQLAQLDLHPLPAPEHESADSLGLAAHRLIEDHRHVERTVAFVRLADHRALVGGLDGLEHVERMESELLEPLRPEAHDHLRNAGRRGHLHVHRAVDLRDDPRDLQRLPVDHVELVPEDIDDDLRGRPR